MGEQRLLVVGVGSELGSLATALLEQHERFAEVHGIDVHPPRRRLRRTTFHRVEHDEPGEFARKIASLQPDVIVHLGVWEPHARLGTKEARLATGNYAKALCEAISALNCITRLVIRSGLEV